MDIISTFISEVADIITFVLASFGLITLLIIIDIERKEKTCRRIPRNKTLRYLY